MANRPHPDKQAVTWRLHRDLLARVRAAAEAHEETVLALVTRALERELDIDKYAGYDAQGRAEVIALISRQAKRIAELRAVADAAAMMADTIEKGHESIPFLLPEESATVTTFRAALDALPALDTALAPPTVTSGKSQ